MKDSSVRKLLKEILTDSRSDVREALLVSLFSNIIALAAPIFVLQVYDRVVFHAGLTTLQALVIGMVFAIAFDFVLRSSRAAIFRRIAKRIDIKLGRRLFTKIMSLPLRELEARPTTFWQTLFRDVDIIRNALSGNTAGLLIDLPFALLFFLVILIIAAPLGIVFLFVIPAFMLLAWHAGRSVGRSSEVEKRKADDRDLLLNEILAARTTVKALALNDQLEERWEGRHAQSIIASQNRGKESDFHQVLGMAMTIATTVSLTSFGALLILKQDLTMGSLIAANMLGGRMVGPISSLVVQWKTIAQFRQSAERVESILSLREEREASAVSMRQPSGRFTIENLTFRYDQRAQNAVEKVGGTIGPCGFHCVVGKNGSGKSTLLKLLAGLYEPSEGRILIDDADIKQFGRRDLAKWIGYLPQEVVLFAGSVRDNIELGHSEACDEDIIEAADKAGVHSAIVDRPDGYDTVLSESGGGLSGGQRQRIAFARALVGNPKILLLDEPSSNLDAEGEAALAATLKEYGKTGTVIAVTHSPALLNAADTLLVMDRGRVTLAGPSGDILALLRGQMNEARKTAHGLSAVPGDAS